MLEAQQFSDWFDEEHEYAECGHQHRLDVEAAIHLRVQPIEARIETCNVCLLYTSDAADE